MSRFAFAYADWSVVQLGPVRTICTNTSAYDYDRNALSVNHFGDWHIWSQHCTCRLSKLQHNHGDSGIVVKATLVHLQIVQKCGVVMRKEQRTTLRTTKGRSAWLDNMRRMQPESVRTRRPTYRGRLLSRSEQYACSVQSSDELQLLLCALKVKDRTTWSHSRRVSVYGAAVARQLGLSSSEIAHVRLAGEVHDIGKLVVPTRLLRKTGALTAQEYEIVMQHTINGAQIVQPLCKQLPVVLDVVRWHHERLDGAGVNDKLRGHNIPLAARIVAVGDAFDAMTSHRPYRGPTSLDAALGELEAHAGTQFDPCCVRALRTSFNCAPYLVGLSTRNQRATTKEYTIQC